MQRHMEDREIRGRRGPGVAVRRDWRGHRRHGGRARRGDIRAAILALLAERPMHGYEVIRELSERTGGVWEPSPGSIYPTLQLLEDEALVSVEESDGRKQYSLTDQGRRRPDSGRRRLHPGTRSPAGPTRQRWIFGAASSSCWEPCKPGRRERVARADGEGAGRTSRRAEAPLLDPGGRGVVLRPLHARGRPPPRNHATLRAAAAAARSAIPGTIPELCGDPRTFGSSRNGNRGRNSVPRGGSSHQTSMPAENVGVATRCS